MRAFAVRSAGKLLEAAAAACLLVLMLLDLVDVLGRNVLNRPVPWSTEVLEIVVAAMVFLLYPALALSASHITVDLIKVGPKLHRIQLILGAIVGAVLFGLIAWCVGRQAIRAAGYGEASPILGIPTADVLGGMALLAGLTLLAFIAALVLALRRAPSDASESAPQTRLPSDAVLPAGEGS